MPRSINNTQHRNISRIRFT